MFFRLGLAMVSVTSIAALWACVGDDPVATPDPSGSSSGGTEDAATDASPDAVSPPFCAGKTALFCSDFTISSPVDQGWDRKAHLGGEGALSRFDGQLQASLEAVDPTPRQAFAYLAQTVDVAQRRKVRVEVSLMLTPQAEPQAGDVEIVSFRRNDGVGWCLTRKGGDAASYVLQAERMDGGSRRVDDLPIVCPEGREIRLQVDLTFGGDSEGKLAYTCDLGAQSPVEAARLTGPVLSESASLQVGLSHALQGQVPRLQVSYDDVLVSEL